MTNVNVFGTIKKIESKSNVVVERCYKSNTGSYLYDTLPCIYWTKTKKNIFEDLKEDTKVYLKGRLECIDEKMYIVVEEFIAF